jgi:beta-glucanase (GH16 family)
MKMMVFGVLGVLGVSLMGAGATEWRVVWSDEFEKEGAPDPGKWVYEEGYVRNNEAQFYTKDRRENARVEKGVLVIEARRERFPLAGLAGNQGREFAEYTSASLTTKGKRSWTYGKIEVRAKLPETRGTWPAIWMLGENMDEVGWPTCGEIDIMEFVGYEPGVVHANVHTRGFNHMKGNGRGNKTALPEASRKFHVYSVEWTPELMEFFVDGKKFFECPNDGKGVDSWPFDAPHYLILNLAIGGAWGGLKGIDAEGLPQRMEVDYVRTFEAVK